MYLQVRLRIDDRDACRFLWRDCKTDTPPRRYRLTRVCFGLACSPYLALNVLKAHAELNLGENNQTVKLALSNMYVDDLVVSCDGEAEVRDLIHRVPVFLRKGGFHLKKWTCNQAALLDTLPREEVSEHGERELGKTLGIYWGKDEDILTFQPPANSTSRSHHTKRQMLSLAARIYDPLGYMAPFTGQIKVLLQSLWTAGIDWDTPLSPGVERRWRDWMEQLEMLPKIRIPRAWIPYPVQQVRRVELHIFGDASQVAYAACAYIMVESTNHHKL
ncbi:Pao retrotransposon peptidase superfamily, partial [Trichinella spiralis]|uniref:Pao retrotransposon peptidase superfamily n=1 Tax=Trichinella spiralis TaxID=6334 RepID=UPI0001EFD47C